MRPRPSPRRALASLAALALAAAAPNVAAAQIIRMQGPSEPLLWASAGVGFTQAGSDVIDGATQSVWRFGNGAQYRASAELAIAHQSSLGVSVTHARLPLTYYDISTLQPSTQIAPDCRTDGCDAHATLESLVATFHSGGGIGVHQVIEASLGAQRYSNFRLDRYNGLAVPPDANVDVTFAVGYGIGYSLGTAGEVTLVQDAAAVLHERTGLRGGQSALTQFYTTRLGLRVGLGKRRPGV